MTNYKKILMIIAALMIAVPGCGGTADDAADTSAGSAPTTAPPTTVAATSTSTTMSHMTSTSEEHEEHSEDEEHEEGADDADVVIEVLATDFAFDPAAYEVSAGQTVKFVMTNNGVVEHEFRLSNEHRIEEHLAAGHEDHDDEGDHHEEGGDRFVLAQPGETVELIMTFPEDTTLYTEVACLLPGHYEAGMKAPLSYIDG